MNNVVELSVVNPDGSCLGTPLRFTAGRATVVPACLDAAEQRLFAEADQKVRTAYQKIRHYAEGDTRPVSPNITRITTAGHTVTSDAHSIPAWSRRYFGPWWNATEHTGPLTGPVVAADIDAAELSRLTRNALDRPHQTSPYAGTVMVHRRHSDGTVTAAQPGQDLAYHYEPAERRLRIVGGAPTPVATAAARLARELLRSQLIADGWQILHASAAIKDGRAVLTLGGKGAGKSTTALLLARAGWRLLANDRVFVRPTADGGVQVLPWPAAAAIGLGLLDALGLYDGVRARVLAGETLHPTQHQRVTDALTSGTREPLWNEKGKELKPQFFPDQIQTWLGAPLAADGTAAHILFPRITTAQDPAVTGEGRELTPDDFFTAGTEDRYPDIFGLAPASTEPHPAQRDDLTKVLSRLPRHGLTLGHDTATNTRLLQNLTNQRAEPQH
ncbi:hypothetical protein [Streptomyces uncialis]|uniref:hypothetical protein n=1 Tax=Streptomyces uncialis TaxID=1048205 RepID=UPI00224FECB3|nr:hypothetical protein [Streptomyces uncialis]MCX4659063.1 hypothetical protein [Streptomyces uncialis]